MAILGYSLNEMPVIFAVAHFPQTGRWKIILTALAINVFMLCIFIAAAV
ncbi:hypothetical protein [[Pantoea] beijingensis]|nr:MULTISPECIES: hypothetical protein [Erwiniaceae]